MTLLLGESLRALEMLNRHMQELLTELLQTGAESTFWVGSLGATCISNLEMQTTATNMVLLMRIPGILPEHLEVEVTQEAAVIRGCRSLAETAAWLPLERFQNVIPFPVTVHPEVVRAELQNDLLTLTLPKSGTTQRQGVRLQVVEHDRQAACASSIDVGVCPGQSLNEHTPYFQQP